MKYIKQKKHIDKRIKKKKDRLRWLTKKEKVKKLTKKEKEEMKLLQSA